MGGEGFPAYVHSAISWQEQCGWQVQEQGLNECGVTTPANALRLLRPELAVTKDQLRSEAGIFFHAKLGGSPSPVSGKLVRKRGLGTHFGNLAHTDREAVLRDLIDRKVLVMIELGKNYLSLGPLKLQIYGQHAVLLVGYSDPYIDAQGVKREEYYLLDAQYRAGDPLCFGLDTNDVDGISLPGNRTLSREEFLRDFTSAIYFPVFRTQLEHDSWYHQHLTERPSPFLIGGLLRRYITGSYDIWKGK